MQGRAQVPGMTPLTLLPTLLYWPTPAVEPVVGSAAALAPSRHSDACTTRLVVGDGAPPHLTRRYCLDPQAFPGHMCACSSSSS